MYCMEYLAKNIDWLQEKLKPLIAGKLILHTNGMHVATCQCLK